MNELKCVLETIDKYSNVINEGDYLEICNNLKAVYRIKEGHSTLFNYEGTILSNAQNVYFEIEFYHRARELDLDFLQYQIEYLMNEKETNAPFQRASKTIQTIAIRHYCDSRDIELEKYTPNFLKNYLIENEIMTERAFGPFIKKLYASYLRMENEFRETYRNNVDKRLLSLSEMTTEI